MLCFVVCLRRETKTSTEKAVRDYVHLLEIQLVWPYATRGQFDLLKSVFVGVFNALDGRNRSFKTSNLSMKV